MIAAEQQVPHALNCVVVVPVYKREIDEMEFKSLTKLVNVLGRYDIKIIAPAGLDCSAYLSIARNATIERFSEKYFLSIVQYNKLMLSRGFYLRFRKYSHMLIYQLDAYVLSDKLQYWCEQDYDYIGAPWFEGWTHPSKDSCLIGVGNGGFSLRRIDAMLAVLSTFRPINSLREIWHRQLKLRSSYLKAFIATAWICACKNNTLLLQNSYDNNEDKFWGLVAPRLFKDYKVAAPRVAVEFAFEVLPSRLYEMNNSQLPFGCHAWLRYEPEFWRRFID